MTQARDLGNVGDTLAGVSNVNIDSGTLFIDTVNNRVGVGTTSPGFGLEVVTANNNGIHLKDSTNTVFGGLFVESGVYSIRARSNHPMLFATNDTERMRIDSSGRVTIPYQPSFLGQTSSFSGAATYDPHRAAISYGTGTVPGLTTAHNIGGHFNTTNGRFTVPVAGRYLFNVIGSNDTTTEGRKIATLSVNGSYFEIAEAWGQYQDCGGTVVLNLAVNDWVEAGRNPGLPIDRVTFSGHFLG